MSEKGSETILRLYDIREAARILRIGVMTLRRRVLSGEIDCFRPSGFGRKILFSESHLRQYVERHTYRGAEQVLTSEGVSVR